jgi:hypothetical protein
MSARAQDLTTVVAGELHQTGRQSVPIIGGGQRWRALPDGTREPGALSVRAATTSGAGWGQTAPNPKQAPDQTRMAANAAAIAHHCARSRPHGHGLPRPLALLPHLRCGICPSYGAPPTWRSASPVTATGASSNPSFSHLTGLCK